MDEDGTVTPVEIRMRGKIKELDFGTWKPGEKSPLKWMVAPRYYKYTQGGDVLTEIDLENMIAVIDGVDRLQEQRRALGDLGRRNSSCQFRMARSWHAHVGIGPPETGI